jgi:hypothetical protein
MATRSRRQLILDQHILSSGYLLFPQSSIGNLGPTEPSTYLHALYTLPFYEDSGGSLG